VVVCGHIPNSSIFYQLSIETILKFPKFVTEIGTYGSKIFQLPDLPSQISHEFPRHSFPENTLMVPQNLIKVVWTSLGLKFVFFLTLG
jgi:hypothetical protein